MTNDVTGLFPSAFGKAAFPQDEEVNDMAKNLKKATELPDMADWSDERIEHWLETHDTSEILTEAIRLKLAYKRMPERTGGRAGRKATTTLQAMKK